MIWVMVQAEGGKRALVNLDACMMMVEGDKGQTHAVSIAGAQVTLVETFDAIAADLVEPLEEEKPGAD